MKEIIRKTTFFAAVAISLAACSKNEAELRNHDGEEALKVSFTAGAETATRTTFGEKDGSAYPVLWTPNTNVAIRYNTTDMTEAKVTPSEDGKTAGFEASFVPKTEVSAHTFIAVSPSTAAVSLMPNETRISIPVEQVSSATSCDEKAQVIRAESTIEGAFPTEVALNFSHITAYGLVTITGIPEGEKIESVEFEADVQLAGNGNYANGMLTMDETAPKSVMVKTSSNDVWFACAPATGMKTLTVNVGTDKNLYTKKIDMTAIAEPNKPIEFIAGTVAKFTVSVADTFDGRYIKSAEDWESFAYRISHGDDFSGKLVSLTTDITVENLSMAKGVFNGKFDGGGRLITQVKNTCPLFETIGADGKVAHLHTAGEFASFDDPTTYGTAVIAATNLGTIDDIVVRYSVKLSVYDDDLFIGMVAIQNGGTISNCINKSNVEIRMEVTKKAHACCGGGIAAFGHTIASFDETRGVPSIDGKCKAGKFINCDNGTETEKVLIKVTGAGNNTNAELGENEGGSITGLSFYGGICGIACVNGTEFTGCRNFGKIARASADMKESFDNTSASAVGGILGISAKILETGIANRWACRIGMQRTAGAAVTITDCTNKGEVVVRTRRYFDVKNDDNMRGNFVGGIVGVACGEKEGKSIVISGCTSEGTVDGGWYKKKETAIGGIAGRACNAKIVDARVSGQIGGSNSKAAAGGFVGQAIGTVAITGTSTSKPAFMLFTPSETGDGKSVLYWGLAVGLAINDANVSIENAAVGGTVKIDEKDVTISTEDLDNNLWDALKKSGSTAKVTVTGITLAK